MKFTPQFERGALRDLKKLDKPVAVRIVRRIQEVAERGYGFEPLTNFRYGWKIRAGSYRALCDIDFEARKISVFVIGHRRDIYR
jgi:mRNA interferase RelE/StbE